MKTVYSLWISIASMLLSIGVVIYVAPREANLGFDYLGLIIGVLALLVTALLAWQIYNAVSFQVKMNELDERFTNLHDSCQKVVDECFDRLAKRNDEGLVVLRDMFNRDMDIMSSLTLLSLNHGVVPALDYAINAIDQLETTTEYIYIALCHAIDGFISDLASMWVSGDRRSFAVLIETIPRERISTLYALKFENIPHWNEGRIWQFKCRLNLLLSNYPPHPTPNKQDQLDVDKQQQTS